MPSPPFHHHQQHPPDLPLALLAQHPLPPGTFIYTRNILNSEPILPLLSLGIGKSSAAHLINAASLAHRARGYK